MSLQLKSNFETAGNIHTYCCCLIFQNPAPAGCSNSLTSYASQSAFTRRRRAADDEATIEATMGVSVEVNQGGSLTGK